MFRRKSTSLSAVEQRMLAVKEPTKLAASISNDETRGAIKSSLDTGAGYATPLIAAGIELDHTTNALTQIVAEIKKNPGSADSQQAMEFLKYAVPVVGKVKADVVRAVKQAGAYINLGNGIQTLMGKEFLGIDPTVVRWYVEQGQVSRQFGPQIRADIGTHTIVGHYTHILEKPRSVQDGAAYHAEFDSCGSRGKTKCATTIDDKCSGKIVDCQDLTCGLYQACQDENYRANAASGSPKGSCDEKHAQQGLVVGTLAQLDLMQELGNQARMTNDKLTGAGKQLYGSHLNEIASSAGLLKTAFGQYMKELKPVLVAQRP